MIAGQIGSGSSSLKTKFLREPHSLVAARARHFCEILCRHRGIGIEVRLDGMDHVLGLAQPFGNLATDDGMRPLHVMGDTLADVMQETTAAGDVDVGPQLVGHG